MARAGFQLHPLVCEHQESFSTAWNPSLLIYKAGTVVPTSEDYCKVKDI